MKHYIAIIHKEEKSDFGVCFPDFPGCITVGSTIDEAKDMAEEALSVHVKGLVEDGINIPEPSSLDEITKHEFYEDAAAVLVVPLKLESKTVRINITLTEQELEKIDKAAEFLGTTRSGLMVSSTIKWLQTLNKLERFNKSFNELERLNKNIYKKAIVKKIAK